MKYASRLARSLPISLSGFPCLGCFISPASWVLCYPGSSPLQPAAAWPCPSSVGTAWGWGEISFLSSHPQRGARGHAKGENTAWGGPSISRPAVSLPLQMSWHPQYRSSKFRHVYGKAASKDKCYDCVPITHSVHDNHFCAVNPHFVAVVTECAGGGAFLVIPIHQVSAAGVGWPLWCWRGDQALQGSPKGDIPQGIFSQCCSWSCKMHGRGPGLPGTCVPVRPQWLLSGSLHFPSFRTSVACLV